MDPLSAAQRARDFGGLPRFVVVSRIGTTIAPSPCEKGAAMRKLTCVALSILALSLAPTMAYANEPPSSGVGYFVVPGAFYGLDTTTSGTEVGGELSFVVTNVAPTTAVGALLQEGYLQGGRYRTTLAGELLVWNVVGLELGGGFDPAGEGRATTATLHVAPFVSVGALALTCRVDVPVATTGPGTSWGTDVALLVSVKLPVFLGGATPPLLRDISESM
jgi:hypothetical protein